MEQSVSLDSNATSQDARQELYRQPERSSEVYSSPRKIRLMERPRVDLPPLASKADRQRAAEADAVEVSHEGNDHAPGGGGDPHELSTMPVLTENGIIHTAVIPVEDGYAIPVIKHGAGFAMPALCVKGQVAFLSPEEVGSGRWWRGFRAQGDSEASTTDPASEGGTDRETHADGHLFNGHRVFETDAGSAPVRGDSEKSTKLLPKQLGTLQWLQRMYREKKMQMQSEVSEPKKSKFGVFREIPKDPDLAACQELMEWLIKISTERGHAEENEFVDLDVKAFASALKKPKVMQEVSRIMRDLQYPGGSHRPFDLQRQAPFDSSVVSLFLYNVPTSTKQLDLLEEVKKRGFHGKLDFLYLPCSREENKNEGYCILSFVDPRYAQEFFWEFHGSFLKIASVTSKSLSVSPTRMEIQGFAALKDRFWSDNPTDPNYDPLFLRAPPTMMTPPPPPAAPEYGWKATKKAPPTYAAGEFDQGNPGYCAHCHTALMRRTVCARCGAKAAARPALTSRRVGW